VGEIRLSTNDGAGSKLPPSQPSPVGGRSAARATLTVGKAQLSFATRLVTWQHCHGRHDLPWQNTRDAYRIWLSEIMLQQTQVATVLGYYERFLKACPTVRDLAAASDDQVMALWAGLGYYTRARNLHKAAKQIVEIHNGDFPNDVEALTALPGIGRSTAAAIAAFAYDNIAPILDGNVKRVLARHAGVEGFPGASAVEKKLWIEAESRLPKNKKEMVAYTQGLMDLGATLCTKSAPTCMLCPITDDCAARISGRIDEIPAPRPSKPLPHRSQRYLLATHAGSVLLVKRPPSGIWGSLWCLPEIHDEEDAVATLATRFAATAMRAEAHPPIDHTITHFKLTLHPVQVQVSRVSARASEPTSMWLPLSDLTNAALPAPIAKLLRGLA
jgi:A/G-specific adenine glycosylase